MTQDQYGQARGPGYVVRGDAVPDDETEEYPTEESKPMTRFQKVASALRGGGTEQDELDQPAADPPAEDQAAGNQAAQATDPGTAPAGPPWVTQQDEAVAVTSPDVPVPPDVSARAPETDTDPLTRQDQVTGQVGPDAVDHPATEPDTFGTSTHASNGATSDPQAGEATGMAGRHAAAASADTGSRPGEANGTLGDFSDLTSGNLIADAAVYIEQWQQVQFKFVDDPHASVTEAADIIAQVTTKMEAAIQERQRAIEERQRAIAEQQRSLRGRWGEGTNADTEALRETLRMYKTFLDQLIGARAS